MPSPLLPCPFCGFDKPVYEIIRTDDAIRALRYAVKCPKCGSRGGFGAAYISGKEDAERIWNTRKENP